jgi:hypothetical protein
VESISSDVLVRASAEQRMSLSTIRALQVPMAVRMRGNPASVMNEGIPDERSVRRWARNQGDFGYQYAAARRLGYEKRADELLEIADNSSADWIDTGNGNRVFDSVHVNRARLMIDTRNGCFRRCCQRFTATI